MLRSIQSESYRLVGTNVFRIRYSTNINNQHFLSTRVSRFQSNRKFSSVREYFSKVLNIAFRIFCIKFPRILSLVELRSFTTQIFLCFVLSLSDHFPSLTERHPFEVIRHICSSLHLLKLVAAVSFF